MTILRIYFSAKWRDNASDCPWALLDDSGAIVQSGHGPLASMPNANECIAVIASDRTMCMEVDMPPGPRRRWLNALPFLAEENTLPDPEENHVVPGPLPAKGLGNGRLMLFVTDKVWLRQLVDACRSANFSLRKVVPEIALPAVEPGFWTLVWNGQGGFVCTAPMKGVELDTSAAQGTPLVLQLLLDESDPGPQKIELRFLHNLPPDQRILPEWKGISPIVSPGMDWDWRLAGIPPDAPNMLWGELAPPPRPLEWWPRLRPVAMLVLLVLGIEILGFNLQWGIMAHEKRSLNREMEQSFRQAFGNEAVIVDAPLQMQRNLATLRHGAGIQDDGDFLPLLGRASRALGNLPAGSIREMHFESGRLQIKLELGKSSEVAALQNKLHDMGMDVQADVQDTGNGVNVRLTLQQGAAI
jgi:general secretion pathway protein L